MNYKQKMEAWRSFRQAIHGWSFGTKGMIEGKIERAEKLIESMPVELQEEARDILKSMKEAAACFE